MPAPAIAYGEDRRDHSIVVEVIQKEANPPKARRGRPPAFDADAVIDGAIYLFLENGFVGTTLHDIAEQLDVRASTLYNSFGGKAGLYDAAVDRYLSTADDQLFTPVRDGEAGLDDLAALTHKLTKSHTRPGRPPGCLAVNAMITGEHADAVQRYTQLLRRSIDAALTRAIELAEIKPAAAPKIAAICYAAILGINVAAKSGASSDELEAMHDGFVHATDACRTDLNH